MYLSLSVANSVTVVRIIDCIHIYAFICIYMYLYVFICVYIATGWRCCGGAHFCTDEELRRKYMKYIADRRGGKTSK
jgi:hypothetical protein